MLRLTEIVFRNDKRSISANGQYMRSVAIKGTDVSIKNKT